MHQDTQKRNVALDYLKTIAVVYVVILHVNGYVAAFYQKENYSVFAKYLYYLLEATAIPSIHLFVLIGSYFMISKTSSLKSFIRVYSQTWLITIFGLLVACFIVPKELSIGGVFLSIFPFSQRAYWFVSTYLVLILLSPFLNVVISNVSNRELCKLTGVLFVLTCVLPFISLGVFVKSVSVWSKDSLLLFVLLYFMAAVIKKNETLIESFGKNWLFGYMIMVVLLFLAVLILSKIKLLNGKEMYLFQYASPLVVMEGLCLFNYFISLNNSMKDKNRPSLVKWVCTASLFVYLIHMHPVFKNLYTKYAILSYIDVNSAFYIFGVLLTVIVVVLVSTFLGCCIFGPVSKRIESVIWWAVNKARLYLLSKV